VENTSKLHYHTPMQELSTPSPPRIRDQCVKTT
jgi:hypothetical protein